jgi:ferredoxin
VEGTKSGKAGTEVPKPWATPEMFWPEPTRQSDPQSSANPTVVLTEHDPALALDEQAATEDVDCGNGCGRGSWCAICRAEIREEALQWLRELNVLHQHQPLGLSWNGPWSREIHLTNS